MIVGKFDLVHTEEQMIVPRDGLSIRKVVHVGRDPEGRLCLWAELESCRPGSPAQGVFRGGIYGTGHPLPDPVERQHMGTFVEPPFVWHLYGQVGTLNPTAT